MPVDDLTDGHPKGIIQVGGIDFPLGAHREKVNEHIYGTPEYKNRRKKREEKHERLQTAFEEGTDVFSLVKSEFGRHRPTVEQTKEDTYIAFEHFDTSHLNLRYVDETGMRQPMERITIRYSERGWHAYPSAAKEKANE